AMELLEFHSTAARRARGVISLITSKRFAAVSGALTTNPVRLPPGRARLATSPSSARSLTAAATIGIADVARFTASTTGVPPARNIDLLLNQVIRQFWKTREIPFGPSVLDNDVLSFNVALSLHSVLKCNE